MRHGRNRKNGGWGSLRGSPLSPLGVQGDIGSASLRLALHKKGQPKLSFFVEHSGIEPLTF